MKYYLNFHQIWAKKWGLNFKTRTCDFILTMFQVCVKNVIVHFDEHATLKIYHCILGKKLQECVNFVRKPGFYCLNVPTLFQECRRAFLWTNKPFWNLPMHFEQNVARMCQLCQIAWGSLKQCFNFLSRMWTCIFMKKPFWNLPIHF